MAVIQSDISHIRLYGTIRIWDFYTYPVYQLDEVRTVDDFSSVLIPSNSIYYNYTEDFSTVNLVAGTMLEDLYEAQKEADIFNVPEPYDISFSFGTNYIGHKIMKVNFNSGNSCAINIQYGMGSEYLNDGYNNIIYSVYNSNGVQEPANIQIQSFNGGNGGFIVVDDNGTTKFIRVRIFNNILSPYKYFSVGNSGDNGRGDIFYGCKASTPLSLFEIGDGNSIIEVITDDPLGPVPPSGEGDEPPGNFDDTSDTIQIPPLPTISAANTGFTRIYNPTLSQVQSLARYLWTDYSIIETIWNHIKQFFEDPMQAIIGFNLVPVSVPDGGTEEFALMYIGTGVMMTVAANQFVDVDCGTYKLERYYGSALDQSPYTKIHCFLPYIGTVRLNTDEVMGATLSVKYRVDIVTGSCVAMVLVDGNVLYQYSGHCAINIPVSSADFSSYVSAAINVAKTAGMGIAAGAAGAAIGAAVASIEAGQASATMASTTELATISGTNSISTYGGSSSSGTPYIPSPNSYLFEHPPVGPTSPVSYAGLSPQNISNTVSQVAGGKPNIEHSGSFSGNSGYLGVRRPFLIIERPNMCLPENYQSLNGYPAMITMELGTCKGYTRVQQVQLTEMTATNPEQAEILSLLKGGVVF